MPPPVSQNGAIKVLDAAKMNAANGTELVNGQPKTTEAITNAALIPDNEKNSVNNAY